MTSSECIIDFLNRNNIKWCPVNLSVETKRPINFKRIGESGIKIPCNKKDDDNFMFNGDNYKKIQKEQKDSEFIWIDTYEVSQLDIDNETDFKIDAPYFESMTKKLPHYFITKTQITNKTRLPAKLSDGAGVDILKGQSSYARRDALVFNKDKAIKNFDKEISKAINPIRIPSSKQLCEQFLLTHEGWIKDTGLWKTYGAIFKSLMPNSYDEFDKISRGEYSKKRVIPELYNSDKNKEIWNSFKTCSESDAYEKLKNLVSKTPKLRKNFNNLETGETETTSHQLALMVCDYYQDMVFAFVDSIFIKQKNGLFYEPSIDKGYAKSVVRRDILLEYSYLGECPADVVDPIQNGGRINQYLDFILDELQKRGRDIYPNLKWDMNSNFNYIGFDNGILRLTDMTFSKTGFDNVFVSWTTRYDFPLEEPSKEILKVFDDWLYKFAKSADGKIDTQKDVINMIVETICDKNAKETVFFLLGEGGNGKSVLCSLLTDLLGQYCHLIPFQSLEDNFVADGKRPDLKELYNKRCIIVGESDDESKISTSTFKALSTSKDQLKVRDLHEKLKDQKPFNVYAKMFCPINGELKFNSVMGNSLRRRVKCQNAPNTFMEKINKPEHNILPRDYKLINDLNIFTPYLWYWLKPHILNYYNNGLPDYSSDFEESSSQFIKQCDTELNAFLEEVEEATDGEVIVGEIWDIVSRKNKLLKKKNFFKSLKENFDSNYITRKKRIGKKVVTQQVVYGYTLPVNEYIIDED